MIIVKNNNNNNNTQSGNNENDDNNDNDNNSFINREPTSHYVVFRGHGHECTVGSLLNLLYSVDVLQTYHTIFLEVA